MTPRTMFLIEDMIDTMYDSIGVSHIYHTGKNLQQINEIIHIMIFDKLYGLTSNTVI